MYSLGLFNIHLLLSFVCLVIIYVTPYKSILDKQGKKTKQIIYLIQLPLYIFIFTLVLFKPKRSQHHSVQNIGLKSSLLCCIKLRLK